ncbi:hypothetical protein HDU77_000541, partial [Chytriomyces hyalinus]
MELCKMFLSGWISVETDQHANSLGKNELEILIATPMVLPNACPKAPAMIDSLEDGLLKKFFKNIPLDATRGVNVTIWAVWAKPHQTLK